MLWKYDVIVKCEAIRNNLLPLNSTISGHLECPPFLWHHTTLVYHTILASRSGPEDTGNSIVILQNTGFASRINPLSKHFFSMKGWRIDLTLWFCWPENVSFQIEELAYCQSTDLKKLISSSSKNQTPRCLTFEISSGMNSMLHCTPWWTSWWLNQPIWKICWSKWESCPKDRGDH